jgi:hypothetical protein
MCLSLPLSFSFSPSPESTHDWTYVHINNDVYVYRCMVSQKACVHLCSMSPCVVRNIGVARERKRSKIWNIKIWKRGCARDIFSIMLEGWDRAYKMLDREYLNFLSHVLHGAVLISRLSAQPIQDFTEVLKVADISNAHKNEYTRTYSSSKHKSQLKRLKHILGHVIPIH